MSVQRYTFWATNTQQATFYACATEGEFPTEEVGPKDVVYCKGALKKRNASNSAWVAVNPEDCPDAHRRNRSHDPRTDGERTDRPHPFPASHPPFGWPPTPKPLNL